MTTHRVASKNTRDLISRIQAAGGTVRRTRKSHYAVYFRGRMIGVLSGTASDPRAHRNSISQLRARGLPV